MRALVVIGGNPVASWTDQLRTVEAMRSLDLLVCIDLFETATTDFAHYVFAGKHPFEVPGTTQLMEEAGASLYRAKSSDRVGELLFRGGGQAARRYSLITPPTTRCLRRQARRRSSR